MKLLIMKIFLAGMLFVGLTGCGPSFEPDKPTLDFAKKYNLKNRDYQNSEIMCITSEPLSRQEKSELLSITMSKMSKFYISLCKSKFLHLVGSYPNTNWRPMYENCINFAVPSVRRTTNIHLKKINDKTFKYEFRYYHGLYSMDRIDKSDLLGYLGFDETLGYDIIYIGDITNETRVKGTKTGIIRESVLEFMRRHPNKCKSLKIQ